MNLIFFFFNNKLNKIHITDKFVPYVAAKIKVKQ